MRNKYILAFFCCLVVSLTTMAQSNKPTTATQVPAPTQTPVANPVYPAGMKVNYVRTKEAMASNLAASDFDNPDYQQVKEATQYIDGLGRPIQTVVRQATPGTSPKDIISPVTYDEFGREVNKYLPYVQDTGSAGNNGHFKTDPFNSQQHFYQTVYPTQDAKSHPLARSR